MTDEITLDTQTPQTEPQIEPIPEPVETIIPTELEPTAQIPVSEPLPTQTENQSEIETEPIVEIIPVESKPPERTSEIKPVPEVIPFVTVISKSKSRQNGNSRGFANPFPQISFAKPSPYF